MAAELKRVDELRSRALRLQYKVEQLEWALNAIVPIANPQWLDEARADVAVAKTGFLAAMNDFAAPFEEWRTRAYREFGSLRMELIGGVGVMEFAPNEGRALDFEAVDAAVRRARPIV
jgi:hypothetical protein